MIDRQIEELYHQGAAVEEIAAALKCDPQAVRFTINRLVGNLSDDNVVKEMEGIIIGIARNEDNEIRYRLDAAKFAVEVGKGIKNNKNALPFIPAVQINQLLISANQDVLRFVSSRNQGANRPLDGDSAGGGQSAENPEIAVPSVSDPNPPVIDVAPAECASSIT